MNLHFHMHVVDWLAWKERLRLERKKKYHRALAGLAREPLRPGDVVNLRDGRTGYIRARIFGLNAKGQPTVAYTVQLSGGRGAVEVAGDRIASVAAVAA